MEERLYVRELVASKFHDARSSRLSEANGKATSPRSEKPDSPHVTVRRIDLSGPKFRVSRRRCADWSSLGYGSDDRSRGRASPARVPSKDSFGVANETTARDDRARDRRRTLSARGNTCGIQIGPSVHIVERQLARQDLEDVHISPGSSRAQSHANTATYTLRHDAVRNANDPEGTSTTRRVRLDTLQREKPIGRLIIEAVPTNPASEYERDLEEVKNSDFGQDDGRIGCPKGRIYRRERKDGNLGPQDTEGISECLKNTTNQGTTKFAVIETPGTMKTWNEKLKNKAANENREEIACGSEEISYAEDDGIFRKRSGTDCLRNDENIADKIQAEENQGDRSKPSLAGDTSRKTAFPRRENIASLCREAESPIPYRTIDGHFSHTFNSHNGQDGLCSVAEDARRRSFVSDCAEDDLDEVDLYRPRLDDLDSILHSNDRKIERVVRTTRNLSELLSKVDEDEPRDTNREKLGRDSSADKSILEIEQRNEDLTEVRRIDEEEASKGTNAVGTRSSAFARESNGSRSNHSKNSVESSVFPASDASDDPRTSRDGDKAQRSAAEARLSESSMDDGSDVTTFSNLVPALSSTHTEPQTCRLRQEEIARSDRHAKSRVTSANKLFKGAIRHSGKEYSDDGTFARLSRKDAFRATDRLVTYILQDEERSIEGKVACALKESAITPATVQKLLDHLREAESIRDARQTETLDILRNILINVKGQSDRGSANGKETSSRNVPDSSARTRAPPIAVDGLTSREDGTREMRAKIEWVAKNLYEPKGHSDFSECRETRESARSTVRCESTQCSEMNDSKGDTCQVKSTDVAKTAPIDAKNQTDEGENDPGKEKTDIPRDVAGSSTRTNAIEGTILRTRARNNTSDTGLIADKPEDSRNPDKYFSETRESVRSAARLEFARGSKNKSRDNSKGNSCSEAESLKQISDIRSDDDENLGGNSERLSAKIASARLRGEREVEVAAIVASETKGVNNEEKLEEDKSNDARANNQDASKIITQTDRMIDAQSGVPEEAVEEIRSEKTRGIATSAEKKVLFALSEAEEIKNERVRSNASPVRTKLIEAPTKTDVDFVHSSTKEDIGSSRETENDSQRIAIEGKIEPADNCSADPRGCIVKSSEQELPSRNKEVSLGIAGKDNLKDVTNEETRKSMTAVENRRDGNETSGLGKSTRSDNESIDLTYRPRNYKINVLSSSNSSVSSTLLDHDDR